MSNKKLGFDLPSKLNIDLYGSTIAVSPLETIEMQTKIIHPDKSIVNPTTGDRFDLDKSKKYQGKAYSLYEISPEHPFQAIVTAISKEAAQRGVRVGDLIYGDTQIYTSRRLIKINGYIYVIMGVDSILASPHHFELPEAEEIDSFYINGIIPKS